MINKVINQRIKFYEKEIIFLISHRNLAYEKNMKNNADALQNTMDTFKAIIKELENILRLTEKKKIRKRRIPIKRY